MIRDARSVPTGDHLTYDLCIVGGGPAGLTLAKELSGTGARIALLEAGGMRYQARSQALFEGAVEGHPYPPLRDTRLSALGGSTQVWAGWSRPLDPIDFEHREGIPGRGWPFVREALDVHYARAQELLRLPDPSYDPEHWSARSGYPILPLPPGGARTIIFQASPGNFANGLLPELLRWPNLDLFLHAHALRLRMAPVASRVASVQVGALNGTRFDLAARVFILAAGGIENPRLLLLSGESPERSIGNARDMVGRHFTEHLFHQMGRLVPTAEHRSDGFYRTWPAPGPSDRHPVRGGLSLAGTLLRREGLLNGACFLRPPHEIDPVFDTAPVTAMLELWERWRGRGIPGRVGPELRRAVRSPAALGRAIWKRIAVPKGTLEAWPLRWLVESESRPENRVRLGALVDLFGRAHPRVEWRPSDRDLWSAQRSMTLLDEALRSAGVGRLEGVLPPSSTGWRDAVVGAKHHLGTTRMDPDPAAGVVDENARVHGIGNLYLAGGSIFPSGGFANPTLTIIALAHRLARHLTSTGALRGKKVEIG